MIYMWGGGDEGKIKMMIMIRIMRGIRLLTSAATGKLDFAAGRW